MFGEKLGHDCRQGAHKT